MEKIIIENVFTEEDKEFNRMMVNNALIIINNSPFPIDVAEKCK